MEVGALDRRSVPWGHDAATRRPPRWVRVLSMGPREYELVGWVRRLPLVLVLCFVIGPAVLLGLDLASGDAAAWRLVTRGVVLGVGLGVTVWQGFVMPCRVVLDDDGVRLVARLRTVEVPWADLVRLGHGRFDFGGDQLRWERRWGRSITTSSRFVGLHEMLGQIARRAPAALTSAGPGRRSIKLLNEGEPGR